MEKGLLHAASSSFTGFLLIVVRDRANSLVQESAHKDDSLKEERRGCPASYDQLILSQVSSF
jgi:hypothetical protein